MSTRQIFIGGWGHEGIDVRALSIWLDCSSYTLFTTLEYLSLYITRSIGLPAPPRRRTINLRRIGFLGPRIAAGGKEKQMGNRSYYPFTREQAYDLCVNRDGPKCKKCRRMPKTKRGHTIDHIDNDPTNNAADGSNFRLLCRSCNTAKQNRLRARKAREFDQLYRPESVDDAHPINGVVQGRVTADSTKDEGRGEGEKEEALEEDKGSAEYRASKRYKKIIRGRIDHLLKRGERLTLEGVRYSGAAWADCDPEIVVKYLKVWTSDGGHLDAAKDGEDWVLSLREAVE